MNERLPSACRQGAAVLNGVTRVRLGGELELHGVARGHRDAFDPERICNGPGARARYSRDNTKQWIILVKAGVALAAHFDVVWAVREAAQSDGRGNGRFDAPGR